MTAWQARRAQRARRRRAQHSEPPTNLLPARSSRRRFPPPKAPLSREFRNLVRDARRRAVLAPRRRPTVAGRCRCSRTCRERADHRSRLAGVPFASRRRAHRRRARDGRALAWLGREHVAGLRWPATAFRRVKAVVGARRAVAEAASDCGSRQARRRQRSARRAPTQSGFALAVLLLSDRRCSRLVPPALALCSGGAKG